MFRVLCVFLVIGCAQTDGRKSSGPSEPDAVEEPNPSAVRSEGEPCAKPEDCDVGLTCSSRDVCSTPATLKCLSAPECEEAGQCTARDGECIVASDADCQYSMFGCQSTGRCTERDGECIVASDADCQTSFGCGGYGKCTDVKGECVATTDADCRESFWCERAGECTAVGGECVATSNADCRASSFCAEGGWCTLVKWEERCGAGSNADCEASSRCASKGHCRWKAKYMDCFTY